MSCYITQRVSHKHEATQHGRTRREKTMTRQGGLSSKLLS